MYIYIYIYVLYYYGLLRNLIKPEQTIKKTPNFQKIFMNTWTSLRQSFNAVAWFLLEIFRRLRNPRNL